MRVLHVIAGSKDGGTDKLMHDAATALAEAGLEQKVVTRESDSDGLAALREAGVPVKLAPFDKHWREPTKAMIRTVAHKFQPDVVHYWMGRAAVFAPKSLSARAIGWHGGFHKLERFKHCAWHIAASQDIAERIMKEGAPAERIAVAAPFAEVALAAPIDHAALETPSGAPVVLAFGRLHRKKGLDKVIEAVAGLPGVYLWIVGEGGAEREFRDLAKELGAADRVKLLGRRNDRAALLAACDAVALAARTEPFGHAAAEAWAAGRPVVATDASGLAAGMVDEVNALISPRDDSEGLRQRLSRVLEDAELARRLIERGARAYEAHHTRPAFVRASMALFERVRQGAAEPAARRRPPTAA